MIDALSQLSAGALERLATEVEREALRAPYDAAALSAFLPAATCAKVAASLSALVQAGSTPKATALTLRAVAASARSVPTLGNQLRLVTSGPSMSGESRDNGVAVRELFETVEKDVLVVGYNAYRGAEVFAPLLRRKIERPALTIRCLLNVGRIKGDTRQDSEIVRSFVEQFRKTVWTSGTLPPVYYDPRALAPEGPERSCLHAKCVVADRARALITSANFTEAAQDRNYELGVLIDEPHFAEMVAAHFEALLANGLLTRAAGT